MYRADADAINAQTQKVSQQLNETSNYLTAAHAPLSGRDATVVVLFEGILKTLREMEETQRLIVNVLHQGIKD